MKLSRAFNGFDETYAINDSNGHDLGPTSYLSSKKDVVVQLLRTKVAELKNVKVSRRASLNACSSQKEKLFWRTSWSIFRQAYLVPGAQISFADFF